MKAMILQSITDLELTSEPLVMTNIPDPVPEDDEVLVKVSACGVCHTELDEIEGRTPPLIPEVQEYKLEEANIALTELKKRKIRGAKVLIIR